MKAKRMLYILLCVALVLALTLPPATTLADDTYDGLTVSGGTAGTDYTYSGGLLTVLSGAALELSGSTTTTMVVVQSGITANITLDNVSIDVSGTSGACAFNISGAAANITLDGDNTLKSGGDRAGMSVPEGASVVINGMFTDSLEAVGGDSGSGIGGGRQRGGGSITINGGTIEATGDGLAAGIGGGQNGDGGSITINGGDVKATSGESGAGIGGGFRGDGGAVVITGGTIEAISSNGGGAGIGGGRQGGGGDITITGGTVEALGNSTGEMGSAGIGGGHTGDGGAVVITGGSVYAAGGSGAEDIGHGQVGTGGTLTNGSANGNANVYVTEVTLQGANAGDAVFYLDTSAYYYSDEDMYTVDGGKLYLYLPEGTTTTSAIADGTFSGSIETTTDVETSKGILEILKPFSVESDGRESVDYTYTNTVLTFINPVSGGYKVSMRAGVESTTVARIVVNGGTASDPIEITLSGIHIDMSGWDGFCALSLTGECVDLTLEGTNTLQSGLGRAGIEVPDGTSVTIHGPGTLGATGGQYGAGIGGGQDGGGGSITIDGGIIEAVGKAAAGIGGGYEGDGGTIEISGGTIAARGDGVVDLGGAGIGGGYSGNGSDVVITGGSVHAEGGSGADDIGNGSGGTGSGTLTNGSANGEDNVFLTGVTLQGVSAVMAVSSLTTSAAYYGINDMYTDDSGKLYLYLPEGTVTTQAWTTIRYSGSITTSGMGGSGTLDPDTESPEVSSVSPDGTDGPVGGDIIIAFNEMMDDAVEGEVHLSDDGGSTYDFTLTGGSWNTENTVYTVGYSGLSYGTEYTVAIAGFQDASGNAMAEDTGHSFTTMLFPEVESVSPGGTDEPVGGDIVITFNKAMDDAVEGEVRLSSDGGSTYDFTLTGGSWSAGNTAYTVAYSGLSYGTEYTVVIAGFQDESGNVMAEDTGHSFTTTACPEVVSVSPGGANQKVADNVIITFNKAMNDAVEGEVRLSSDGGSTYDFTLTGGSWSAGNTVYTVAYSGLSYGTEYTVVIAGFQDESGNVMAEDTGHSFATATRPEVESVSPGGANQPVGGDIVINFDKAMDDAVEGEVRLSSDGGSTYDFTLTGGSWSAGNTVYTVGYSGLSYGTEYTVVIAGFQDASGNVMAEDTGHSFATATRPEVESVSPGGANQKVADNVIITFNKAMNDAVEGEVRLSSDGGSTYDFTLTGGSWSAGNTVYTVGYSGLSYGTEYTVVIAGFQDASGNAMAEDTGHSFTTMLFPEVESVSPGGTDEPVGGDIVITFNKAMDDAVEGEVRLSSDGGSTYDFTLTGGSWNTENTVYTVGYSGLSYGTEYTVAIAGFQDASGNAMAEDTGHSFTTMLFPEVESVSPGGTDEPVGGDIVITFNKVMNDAVEGEVYLSDDGGSTYDFTLTGGSWSAGNTVYTVAYSGLSYGTEYTVVIAGFQDESGNVMAEDTGHSFATATRPEVVSVSPGGANQKVADNVIITFNKAMNDAVEGEVRLSSDGGSTYDFTLTGGSWSAGNTVYTVAYSGLSHGTEYTVVIAGFQDASGNVMAEDTGHSFTTLVEYPLRTLVNSDTGIVVSGNIRYDAALTVTDMILGDDPACDEIRRRMEDDAYTLLLGKDISLLQGFIGTLSITMPVDAQYNGQIVTILHCAGGTLQTYTATVLDAKATFYVTSLSPFAIFADAQDGNDDIPKTGDNSRPWLWWLLCCVSAAGIAALVILRKLKKGV